MKDKIKAAMISENRILGFRVSDLLGILIMIIPLIITIRFQQEIPGKYFLFFQIQQGKTESIRPGLISMLIAVIFYLSLMVRYEGVFRKRNLFEVFVSIVRMTVNCWVIAALVTLVIPETGNQGSSLFAFLFSGNQSTILVIALLLSWLGMKTIAGFSWVLFIAAAWSHLTQIDAAMKMGGAIFVLTFALSLFLQIKDYTDIKDFWKEFKQKARPVSDEIKTEINAAADDATEKARMVSGFVVNQLSTSNRVHFTPSTNEKQSPKAVKINLEALDFNKDGVVDDKDFIFLKQVDEHDQQN